MEVALRSHPKNLDVSRRPRGKGFIPLVHRAQYTLQGIKASRVLPNRYPPTPSNLNRTMLSLISGIYTITNGAINRPVGRVLTGDGGLGPGGIVNHSRGFQGENAKVSFLGSIRMKTKLR